MDGLDSQPQVREQLPFAQQYPILLPQIVVTPEQSSVGPDVRTL